MTKTWKIGSLKEKIRAVGSESQAAQLTDALESIVDRQFMCNYHRNTFKVAYDEFLPSNSNDRDVMLAVLDDNPDGRVKRMEMHTACAANAIGYMQCAHAVVDTLAHVIYYSLSFDESEETELAPHRINMKTVHGKLSDPRFEKLESYIAAWMSLPKYDYLVDITNQTKHRSLVSTLLNADPKLESDRLHGLKFKSFTKDGREYDEIFIGEFFEDFNDDFFSSVVDIGMELNRLVV